MWKSFEKLADVGKSVSNKYQINIRKHKIVSRSRYSEAGV